AAGHVAWRHRPPVVGRPITAEAQKHQLRVFAHIATLDDAKSLLRAGVDGFLHPVRDRDVDDELLGLLKERPQVFFTPTLFAPRLNIYTAEPRWLGDPALRHTVSAAAIEQVKETLSRRTPQSAAAAR